jgi:formylglycine-generating enzyme required for sulfatase activity
LSLPSETQRERAARHTDGREFPWRPDHSSTEVANVANYCNCYETGLGHTSAVGVFPTGRAVCGALDLAGNDWEWCRTKWLPNYHHYAARVSNEWQDDYLEGNSARVLRGGAWYNDRDNVRCAYRNPTSPTAAAAMLGFGWCWWARPLDRWL